jgi:hypothetical protein
MPLVMSIRELSTFGGIQIGLSNSAIFKPNESGVDCRWSLDDQVVLLTNHNDHVPSVEFLN